MSNFLCFGNYLVSDILAFDKLEQMNIKLCTMYENFAKLSHKFNWAQKFDLLGSASADALADDVVSHPTVRFFIIDRVSTSSDVNNIDGT